MFAKVLVYANVVGVLLQVARRGVDIVIATCYVGPGRKVYCGVGVGSPGTELEFAL